MTDRRFPIPLPYGAGATGYLFTGRVSPHSEVVYILAVKVGFRERKTMAKRVIGKIAGLVGRFSGDGRRGID